MTAPSNEMERLEQQAMENVEKSIEQEEQEKLIEATKKPDKGIFSVRFKLRPHARVNVSRYPVLVQTPSLCLATLVRIKQN